MQAELRSSLPTNPSAPNSPPIAVVQPMPALTTTKEQRLQALKCQLNEGSLQLPYQVSHDDIVRLILADPDDPMEEPNSRSSSHEADAYIARLVTMAAKNVRGESTGSSSTTAETAHAEAGPASQPAELTAPNVWQQKKFRKETAAWRERKLYQGIAFQTGSEGLAEVADSPFELAMEVDEVERE